MLNIDDCDYDHSNNEDERMNTVMSFVQLKIAMALSIAQHVSMIAIREKKIY